MVSGFMLLIITVRNKMKIKIIMEEMPIEVTNEKPRNYTITLVGIGNYLECKFLMKLLRNLKLTQKISNKLLNRT